MYTANASEILLKIQHEIKKPSATTQEIIGLATLAYYCVPFEVAQYSEGIDDAEKVNLQRLTVLLESSPDYSSFQQSKTNLGESTTKMIEKYISRNKANLRVAYPTDLRDSGSHYPTSLGWEIKMQAEFHDRWNLWLSSFAIKLAYPHDLSVQMHDKSSK